MPVRPLVLAAIALITAACAITRAEATVRVALLAPFEGRYREIGYNALYAARLAQQDIGQPRLELLPVDDGGTAASAADRARALALDSIVMAVVALGPFAADAVPQAAFGDLPLVIVGSWGSQPVAGHAFVLSSAAIPDRISIPPDLGVAEAAALAGPVIGGDILSLEQLPALRDSLDELTILSSGTLPGPSFASRYRGDPFAPEPGLLATLVYDAARIAGAAALTGSRDTARAFIAAGEHHGLNGPIRFGPDGYWLDAPLYAYRFDEAGNLQRLPDA